MEKNNTIEFAKSLIWAEGETKFYHGHINGYHTLEEFVDYLLHSYTAGTVTLTLRWQNEAFITIEDGEAQLSSAILYDSYKNQLVIEIDVIEIGENRVGYRIDLRMPKMNEQPGIKDSASGFFSKDSDGYGTIWEDLPHLSSTGNTWLGDNDIMNFTRQEMLLLPMKLQQMTVHDEPVEVRYKITISEVEIK